MTIGFTDNSSKFKAAFEKAERESAKEIAKAAEKHAKENCPVDTGRLKASIKGVADGAMVQVGSALDYAAPVELGSRNRPPSHMIQSAAQHGGEYAAITQKNMTNA